MFINWRYYSGHKMKQKINHSGFSIVELLVVITVIGILAAIVMLAYSGVQNSAHDSAVKSDLRQAADNVELFLIDNPGTYPWSTAKLIEANISASRDSYSNSTNSFIYCANNVGFAKPIFTLGGVSKSGKIYYYSSATEKVQQITSGSLNCSNMGLASYAWTETGYLPASTGWKSWIK